MTGQTARWLWCCFPIVQAEKDIQSNEVISFSRLCRHCSLSQGHKCHLEVCLSVKICRDRTISLGMFYRSHVGDQKYGLVILVFSRYCFLPIVYSPRPTVQSTALRVIHATTYDSVENKRVIGYTMMQRNYSQTRCQNNAAADSNSKLPSHTKQRGQRHSIADNFSSRIPFIIFCFFWAFYLGLPFSYYFQNVDSQQLDIFQDGQ